MGLEQAVDQADFGKGVTMTQPFPIQPQDSRPPAKLTPEKWAEAQQVKLLNVLAQTPEQLKKVMEGL